MLKEEGPICKRQGQHDEKCEKGPNILEPTFHCVDEPRTVSDTSTTSNKQDHQHPRAVTLTTFLQKIKDTKSHPFQPSLRKQIQKKTELNFLVLPNSKENADSLTASKRWYTTLPTHYSRKGVTLPSTKIVEADVNLIEFRFVKDRSQFFEAFSFLS